MRDQQDPVSAGPGGSGQFGRSQQNVFFADNFTGILDFQEKICLVDNMENQPLATGYYVSGAPPGDLPDWFWASAPSSRHSVS